MKLGAAKTWLLPLLIVAAGIGIMMMLVVSRPKAKKDSPPPLGLLVRVVAAPVVDRQVQLEAQGTLIAAQQVSVQAQVSGKVVWLHRQLVPGGRVRKGELLLRIDGREYELALEARRAEVQRSRVELELERGRQVIAEREWRSFQPLDAGAADARPLALRRPQMESSEVAVKAAESALERSRLDLTRTHLEAPFNAIVQSENVEVGQLVGPQSPVATLVGTDSAWVQVSVPVEALESLAIPGIGGVSEGADAIIEESGSTQGTRRKGRIVRLMGEVDPMGRMARLLVEVRDPFALEAPAKSTAAPLRPLLLGSFVRVSFAAKEFKGVRELSREVLRENDRAFVATPENRLAIRKVEVVWRGPRSVLIRSGILDSDRIIESPVPTPTDGLPLRIENAPSRARSGR